MVAVKAGLGAFVVATTGQGFVQWLHLMMSLNLNDNMADVVEIGEFKPRSTQVRPALETRNDEHN